MRCSIALREHHLVSTIHEGLDGKRNGSHTAIIHTNTEAAAIEQGRILSKVESTGFIIQRKVEGFRDLKGMGLIRIR